MNDLTNWIFALARHVYNVDEICLHLLTQRFILH